MIPATSQITSVQKVGQNIVRVQIKIKMSTEVYQHSFWVSSLEGPGNFMRS